MASNTAYTHSYSAARQFVGDMLIVLISFYLAAVLRFNDWQPRKTDRYFPAVALGAFTFACTCYITGLYAPLHVLRWRTIHRGARLLGSLTIGMAVMLAAGSIFLSPVGRGVLGLGLLITAVLVVLHHWLHSRLHRDRTRESVVCIVTQEIDEAGARLFKRIEHRGGSTVAMVVHGDHKPSDDFNVLGGLNELDTLIRDGEVTTVLCSEKHLEDHLIGPMLRQARYAGVEITTLASACEEVYHAMPLELVTDGWLVAASAQPRIFYIRRAKRVFDVVVSLTFLVLLAIPLLLGMLLVRISSPGRIFYSQIRVGRFGKLFTIYKLRSMHENAEADGARWASTNDPRLFTVGKWLRKFRIDEIPQLWNILRGDMSFVGPRPERPEFVATLSQEIPWFAERNMVQPGLTGWAQARYPYGASVEDARRKLEYDLYYVKHMGLLLDSLILLDTARIVFTGGVRKESWEGMARFAAEVRAAIGVTQPPPTVT